MFAKSAHPVQLRIEVGELLSVRLGRDLEQPDDVVHIVHVDDGVVDGADDLHGVHLEDLAASQVGGGLQVLQVGEESFDVVVRFEQSEAEGDTTTVLGHRY